jgi:uncharacterized protein (DUF305 family)
METKPLLYGLIGFFIGGLLVSAAATYMEPRGDAATMDDRITRLEDTRGDDYDEAFIESMIVHHEGAIDMARLSADRARHDEIKQLSVEIIMAQEKEIADLRKWQSAWKYPEDTDAHQDRAVH